MSETEKLIDDFYYSFDDLDGDRLENARTALLAHIAEKDARIAELEPNAKRYLWLRERNVFRSDPPVCHVKWEIYRDGVWSHTERPSGAELDTAIDAAMGDK